MFMLRQFLMSITLTLLISAASLAHASNLSKQLLTIPMTLTTGEVVTLEQYQGKKPVYLKFWATWCKPCIEQMPHFEKISQQHGDDLAVIAINLGINDNLAAVHRVQEEFNLTMPMVIDSKGDLAQAFRLLGTPYHLLFDKHMNLVHLGHKADSVLDNKIALISATKELELLADDAITETEMPLNLELDDSKTHAFLFTATWCDWYFKDTRPAASKQCIAAQSSVNNFTEQFDKFAWQGVISRLWTGPTELANYVKKYQIKHPITIDVSNSLFHQYEIKEFPSLVMVKDGVVILKTSDFSDHDSLAKQLSKL
ncbi:TlpA family protein disulfide reductase [Colwellia psychrerythraea]|uniref:Redoxin domain protein n=1 Tax=Colwellia psychrerythraea TaxID=28229 RepID=A0A099KAH4_COLPS|nr:TlpA disulfide reductase family protein [Colwellia psychrerythraea]KGJ87062.1 Redoxin domain protein [Colwellia psychrerythraea]